MRRFANKDADFIVSVLFVMSASGGGDERQPLHPVNGNRDRMGNSADIKARFRSHQGRMDRHRHYQVLAPLDCSRPCLGSVSSISFACSGTKS